MDYEKTNDIEKARVVKKYLDLLTPILAELVGGMLGRLEEKDIVVLKDSLRLATQYCCPIWRCPTNQDILVFPTNDTEKKLFLLIQASCALYHEDDEEILRSLTLWLPAPEIRFTDLEKLLLLLVSSQLFKPFRMPEWCSKEAQGIYGNIIDDIAACISVQCIGWDRKTRLKDLGATLRRYVHAVGYPFEMLLSDVIAVLLQG